MSENSQMSDYQIFSRAADIVESRWTQGSYKTQDGRHCYIGAIFAAQGIDPKSVESVSPANHNFKPIDQRLVAKIDAELQKHHSYRWVRRITLSSGVPLQRAIESWNDTGRIRRFRKRNVVRSLRALAASAYADQEAMNVQSDREQLEALELELREKAASELREKVVV